MIPDPPVAAYAMTATKTPLSERPIETDDAMERTYIPLPGGWEIQTRGKGSTFRICDPKGERLPVEDTPYLHETLEQLARDIHAAHLALTQRLADAEARAMPVVTELLTYADHKDGCGILANGWSDYCPEESKGRHRFDEAGCCESCSQWKGSLRPRPVPPVCDCGFAALAAAIKGAW